MIKQIENNPARCSTNISLFNYFINTVAVHPIMRNITAGTKPMLSGIRFSPPGAPFLFMSIPNKSIIINAKMEVKWSQILIKICD